MCVCVCVLDVADGHDVVYSYVNLILAPHAMYVYIHTDGFTHVVEMWMCQKRSPAEWACGEGVVRINAAVWSNGS